MLNDPTRHGPGLFETTQAPTSVIVTFLDALGKPVTISVEQPRLYRPIKILDTYSCEGLARGLLTSGTHYKLPPGKTVVCEQRLSLSGLSDIVLDGQGSKIRFTNQRDGGIFLQNMERFSLQNIKFVFDGSTTFPLFSNGTVDENGILSVPGVPSQTPIYTISTRTDSDLWGWNEKSNFVEQYLAVDATIGNPKLSAEVVKKLRNRTVFLRHCEQKCGRNYHTITTFTSRHMHYKNLTILSGPSMGMKTVQSQHLLLSGVRLQPDADHNQIASTMLDGFHAFADIREVIIENSDFSRMGDDVINIHTKLLPVEINSVSGEPTRLTFASQEKWQFRETTEQRGDARTQNKGRSLILYDPEMKEVGTATVEEITYDPEFEIILTAGSNPVPSIVATVIFPDTVPQKILIRNNIFHQHRARGMLLQGNQIRVENTTVKEVSMEAILVKPESNGWHEGPGLQNAVFAGNRLVRFGATRKESDKCAVRVERMKTPSNCGSVQNGFNSNIRLEDNNVYQDSHIVGKGKCIEEGLIHALGDTDA